MLYRIYGSTEKKNISFVFKIVFNTLGVVCACFWLLYSYMFSGEIRQYNNIIVNNVDDYVMKEQGLMRDFFLSIPGCDYLLITIDYLELLDSNLTENNNNIVEQMLDVKSNPYTKNLYTILYDTVNDLKDAQKNGLEFNMEEAHIFMESNIGFICNLSNFCFFPGCIGMLYIVGKIINALLNYIKECGKQRNYKYLL